MNKITKYNEDGLIERSYEYPIGSSLGYKILFEAEIEAQYLDAANINIEAGLRASNRSHLRNIHIRLRDRALDLDTKKYLIEHVQQLLIRLTGDSPYQNELRKAYRELIINIDSLPEQ